MSCQNAGKTCQDAVKIRQGLQNKHKSVCRLITVPVFLSHEYRRQHALLAVCWGLQSTFYAPALDKPASSASQASDTVQIRIQHSSQNLGMRSGIKKGKGSPIVLIILVRNRLIQKPPQHVGSPCWTTAAGQM